LHFFHFLLADGSNVNIFLLYLCTILLYRLFTHGYSFFAPPEAVVYHLWTRTHRPTFYNDSANADRASSNTQEKISSAHGEDEARLGQEDEKKALRRQSENRVKALLGMPNNGKTGTARDTSPVPASAAISGATSRFGLGSVRTLADFQQSIGVNFSTRELLPGARNAEYRLPEEPWSPYSSGATGSQLKFAGDECSDVLTLLFQALSQESKAVEVSTKKEEDEAEEEEEAEEAEEEEEEEEKESLPKTGTAKQIKITQEDNSGDSKPCSATMNTLPRPAPAPTPSLSLDAPTVQRKLEALYLIQQFLNK
jgi:hypothetical protein